MNAGRDLATELGRIVGEKFVSVGRVDLSIYNHDPLLPARDLADLPQAVVRPADETEVQALVRFAAAEKIPLLPNGSGGSGAAAPGGRGIVIDLKRLDRILAIDEQGLTVTAEAGIAGEILERGLNLRGFTLGHFPSSTTYGGWLSTCAAGPLSAGCGRTEEVVSLRAVLPDGEIFSTPPVPLPGPGPDWNHVFVRAEGTLGLITSATCRIRPLPASRLYQGYSFGRVEDGFEAVRRIMQSGQRPADIRLSDPVDTFFSRTGRIVLADESAGSEFEVRAVTPPRDLGAWPRRALSFLFRPAFLNSLLGRLERSNLMLAFEGDPEVVRLEQSQARGLCAATGGHDRGDAPASPWRDRSQVGPALAAMFAPGPFVDAIEVAAGWDNLANLYYSMRESIGRHALVRARFGHAGEQGCSIHFSVAAAGRAPEENLDVYGRVWDAALRTSMEKGGAISPCHGAGVKAGWVMDQPGGAWPLFRALKDAADPVGIMNPGKPGPVADGSGGGQ